MQCAHVPHLTRPSCIIFWMPKRLVLLVSVVCTPIHPSCVCAYFSSALSKFQLLIIYLIFPESPKAIRKCDFRIQGVSSTMHTPCAPKSVCVYEPAYGYVWTQAVHCHQLDFMSSIFLPMPVHIYIANYTSRRASSQLGLVQAHAT